MGFLKVLCIWLVLPLIAGCANVGKGHLFEPRAEVENAAKQFSPPPVGLVSVYLISDKFLMQDLSWVPASSAGLIANDKIVSIAPRGSFVHLLFQPGRHKLGVMVVPSDKRISGSWIHDVRSVTFDADKTYIFNLKAYKLNVPSYEEGWKKVQEYRLAKSIHIPISIEQFEKKQQQIANETLRKEAEAARQRSARDLELAQTVDGISDFFAAAAAVAVVALFVVGFGLAMSSGQPAYVPPPIPFDVATRPAYVSGPTAIRSSTGKTMQLELNKGDQTSINNLSTGIRYRLDGDRYIGTDGSWYRVSGNTIYSNTGNYYTRSGNVLTSNDGRQCQIIGSMISC